VYFKQGKISRSQFDSQTDEEAPANQWLAVILLFAGLVTIYL